MTSLVGVVENLRRATVARHGARLALRDRHRCDLCPLHAQEMDEVAPYGMSKGMASGVPPDGGFAGGGCCAIAWLPTSSASVNAEAIDTTLSMKPSRYSMLSRTIAGAHRSANDVKRY